MDELEEDSNSRTEITNVNQDANIENKMSRGYNIPLKKKRLQHCFYL